MADLAKATWEDTSAGRLYKIFETAKQQPTHLPSRQCWAKVFDIKPESVRQLLRHLAEVSQLFFTIQKELIELGDVVDLDHLGSRFEAVATCLSEMNLNASFDHVLRHLDETTMYSLKGCAIELFRHGKAAKIPEKELADLKAVVRIAIDQTVASTLDRSFKVFLLKYLKLIDAALLDYAVTGAEGVAEALERALGAVLANPEMRDQIADSPIGQNWWKVVVETGKVVSSATAVGKAAHWAYKFFAQSGIDDLQKLLPQN